MKWISVKDKLPPDCSRYATRSIQLICNDGFVTIGYFYPTTTSSDHAWSDVRDIRITKQVTHWMPLPEPPKEG